MWKSTSFFLVAYFFAYVISPKWRATQRKKLQGNVLQLKWRSHAKIQLIWSKNQKQPKSSLINPFSKNFFNCKSDILCGRRFTVENSQFNAYLLLNKLIVRFFLLFIQQYRSTKDATWKTEGFLHMLFFENKEQPSRKNYRAMFYNWNEGRTQKFS